MVTLQVIEGQERGRVYRDLAAPVTLGREEDNAIRINDERVSRFHAKIQVDSDRVILTDLESTNGTRVNGHPIQMRVLRPGDQISIGRSVLVFGEPEDLGPEDGPDDANPLEGPTSPGGKVATHDGDEPGELFPEGPPPLPTGLSPSQRAELNDLLTYVHQQAMVVGLQAYAGEDEANGEHTVVPAAAWRHFVGVQAALAAYLKRVTGED